MEFISTRYIRQNISYINKFILSFINLSIREIFDVKNKRPVCTTRYFLLSLLVKQMVTWHHRQHMDVLVGSPGHYDLQNRVYFLASNFRHCMIIVSINYSLSLSLSLL